MKGIVLAGGAGTRLHPITLGTSKQLLAVYDKPMVYYPLSVLMLAGIRDILIITTPEDQPAFKRLLGDGASFGVRLFYEIQEKPNGLPMAFVIGEKFIGKDSVALILGDNVFYGSNFVPMLQEAASRRKGGTVFAYWVKDPERFGIVEIDASGKALSLEEKPRQPKSNYAVTGLYFFDNDVISVAKSLKPSPRGETEIVGVMQHYLASGRLTVERLGRGFAWLDMGTHDAMMDAANFIHTIQSRQGLQVANLQEIAYSNKWMTAEQVREAIRPMLKTEYAQYLLRLIQQ